MFRLVLFLLIWVSLLSCQVRPEGSVVSNNSIDQFHSITLDFYLPDREQYRAVKESGLDVQVAIRALLVKAEQCYESAVAAAGVGKSIDLKLRLGKIEYLDDEQFHRLPQNPTDLPIDHNGALTRTPGCKTNRYPVYIGVTNAILPALDAAIEPRYRKYLADRAKLETMEVGSGQWCQSAKLISDFAQSVAFPLPSAAQLHFDDGLLKVKYEAGQVVGLDSNERYFLHEIMHVWGGLADRYLVFDANGENVYDAANLMHQSDTYTCKLNSSQLEAIADYLSPACKRENLQPNKGTRPASEIEAICSHR